MEVITFNNVSEVVSKQYNARRNAFVMTGIIDVFLIVVFTFVVPIIFHWGTILFLVGISIIFWLISYLSTYLLSQWGRAGMTVNTDLTDTRVWSPWDWFAFLNPVRGVGDVIVVTGHTDYQKKITAGTLEVDNEGLRLLVFLKWNDVEDIKKINDTQIIFTKKSSIPGISSLFGLRTIILQFQSIQDEARFIDIANQFVKAGT